MPETREYVAEAWMLCEMLTQTLTEMVKSTGEDGMGGYYKLEQVVPQTQLLGLEGALGRLKEILV